MPTMTEEIQSIIDTLESAKADAAKHDKGVKTAGTRLRKTLQGLKANTQGLRVRILNEQKGAA